MDKVGRYEFLAEPFHCDFRRQLFLGHLGNHLLNAANFHSQHRGFGMDYLNERRLTWVLSRFAIEMSDMPLWYVPFTVETWVEDAMHFFTSRNFRVVSPDGKKIYGYGKSIWAMIDTDSRQPQNLLSIKDSEILKWVVNDKPCPIAAPSRVKISGNTRLLRAIDTYYNDVDVNGHINSIRYIEHVLDLFPMEEYKRHRVERIEIAYVAEAHAGDRLSFSADETGTIGITKSAGGGNEEEVARCRIKFV